MNKKRPENAGKFICESLEIQNFQGGMPPDPPRTEVWAFSKYTRLLLLRAAPLKYQLDLEIAKKSNFSKLAHNEALWALVTKILFYVR